jgi:hypothetical protein
LFFLDFAVSIRRKSQITRQGGYVLAAAEIQVLA